MDPDHNVRSLQRKVQWDIRYYFARRGAENMHAMVKDDFKLVTDPTGVRYITKARDEETKNHKETDQDIISGFMPEQKDDKYCPVTSYLKYVNGLSPNSDKLWQTAKNDTFPSDSNAVLYYGKMGHNKIDNFIADVCELLKLPNRYTNHSLRVTAINILTRENYTNKQIMSITGHKSSASLEIYQRVNAKEKIQMGNSLGKSLTNKTEAKKRPVSSTMTNNENEENKQPPNKMPLVTIPNESDPDFNFSADDILQIVEQCERTTDEYNVTNVNTNNNNNQLTMTSNVIQERSPSVPSFSNCKIGNITINIQK